ncbi:MAG: SDR family oxidoreductase [Rubrivivax sp.]
MSTLTLVLGSTGLLGQALMRAARAKGHRVQGVARHEAATGIKADLSDPSAVAAILDRHDPAVIINAAAQTDLGACESASGLAWRINTALPGLLATWCSTSGARLVHVSTDHYYCGDANTLHGEDDAVTLVNDYARQKFCAEALVSNCPRSLVVRTNIVGVRAWKDRPTFAEWAFSALRSGQPFPAFVDMWTSSIDADSLAATVLDLSSGSVSGRLNIATRTACSKRDLIVALAEATGLDARLAQRASVRGLAGPRRANALGLDVSRAEALLGCRLPDTELVVQRLAHSLLEDCHAS